MRQGLMTAVAVAALALGGAGALRAEILPSEGDPDGTAPEIEFTVCGQGVLKECGFIDAERCTQYATESAGGSIGGSTGVSGTSGTLSGNLTNKCISYTRTFTKIYKDRYKTKPA